MKRTNLALCVILALCALLLSGCGGKSNGTAPNIGGAAGTGDSSKDTAITKAVQDKIDSDAELKAAGVKAQSSGGQVELTGTVSKTDLKDRAETLAFDVLDPYKDVNAGVLNNITVSEVSGN